MYTDILPDNMPRTQGTEHRICSHIYIYIYIYGMVWYGPGVGATAWER